jgi:hypothetical protein
MFEHNDTESTPTTSEERLPVATFNNSLRQWQARWQAQRAANPAGPSVVREPKIRPRRPKKGVRRR